MPRPRREQRGLIELQREWYAKAKRSGFDDIEIPDSSGSMDGLLRDSKKLSGARADEYEATADYHRRAGIFLHAHRFDNRRERRVWERHADAVPLREIAAELGVHYLSVHRIVTRLRAQMLAGDGRQGREGRSGKRNKRALLNRLIQEIGRMDDETFLSLAPVFVSGGPRRRGR